MFGIGDKPKWLKKVEKLWKKRKIGDIIEFLETHYKEHPDDTKALKLLLEILLAAGMSKKIVELIGESPIRFENGAVMQCFLEALKNIGKKERLLEEAKSFPNDEELLGYLGKTCLKIGDLGCVRRVLKRFEEFGLVNSPDYLLLKGDLLVRLGRKEEAIEVYKRILRLVPKDNIGYNGTIERLRKLGVKIDEDSDS